MTNGIFIIISIIIIVIYLLLRANLSNGSKNVVDKINKCLQEMDRANTEMDITAYYNSIINYFNQLPSDIQLNGMSLQEARSAVHREYANRLSKIGVRYTGDISSSGFKATVHYNSRINEKSKANAIGHNADIPISISEQKIKENRHACDYDKMTKKTYCSQPIIDLQNGYVRIKWEYLNRRFIKGGIMDDDLFWRYDGRSEYIEIPKYRLDEMEQKREKYLAKENAIHRTAMLNNKGVEFEKRRDIQGAINIYEQNISYGDCCTRHTYERLMVLYRKRKDYLNELRIIEKAIAVFPNEQRYKERLKNLKLKLSKL